MVQFEYDRRRKRYDVRIPLVVASISEDNKLSLHRELKLEVVRQILMHWDEYEHQLEMQEKRQAKEYARWELEHDLAKSIDELEFSTRTHNTMQWLGIRTVGELTEKKASELLKFKSFGRKSLTEVEEKLMELGLTLKQ